MNEYVIGFMSLLVMSAIAIFSVTATKYISNLKDKLKSETDKINDDNLRNAANYSIDIINNVVKTIVTSIEQEIASEIRKRISNGDINVSREDLCELKQLAYQRILNNVKDQVMKDASIAVDDVYKYIQERISYEVLNVKNRTIVEIEDNSEEP